MDRIINVKVNGSHLSKDSRYAGVQGEGNAKRLRITFDEGWDGNAKTVTFWNALMQSPVKRVLTADLLEDLAHDTRTYLVPLPPEAMTEAGEMTFTIDGWREGVYREPEDVMTLVLAVTLEVPNVPSIAVEPLDEAQAAAIEGCQVYIGEHVYDITEVELVKGGFTILRLGSIPTEAQGTEYGTQLPVKTRRVTVVPGARQRSVEGHLTVQESPAAEDAVNSVDPTPSEIEQLQGQIDSILGDMSGEADRAETAAMNAEQYAADAGESARQAIAAEAEVLAHAQDAKDSAAAAKASAAAAAESERMALLYESGAYAYMQDAQLAAEEAKNAGGGGGGGSGTPGKDGATFTPSVSPEGLLSWTCDQDREVPAPVQIKPVKGVDYNTEADKNELVQAVLAALPNAEEVKW